MRKSKWLVLGVVMLAAFALPACPGDTTATLTPTPLGALLINLSAGDGGTGLASGGGEGGPIYVYAQGQVSVLTYGTLIMPGVVVPDNTLTITTNTNWTDAMNYGPDGQPGVTGVDDNGDTVIDNCADFGWGDDGQAPAVGATGFIVNTGVTITIDEDDVPCTGGLDLYDVQGPIIINGAIVPDAANVGSVFVDLEAYPPLITDDNTIVINGLINVDGPDNAAGSASDGGSVYLNNYNYDDGPFGVYIYGTISAEGGDSTGADGDGGDGGTIEAYSGYDGDIIVEANLSVAGGDGNGDGWGGDGGWMEFANDGAGDDLHDGQIQILNLNQINSDGGSGVDYGGYGNGDECMYFESDRAGIVINAPIVANGGDATGVDSYADSGFYYGVYLQSNDDWAENADLVGDPDIILLSSVIGVGGDSSYSASGSEGYFYSYAVGGNIFVGDSVILNGGNVTDPTASGYYSNGGGGGYFYAYVYNDQTADYYYNGERSSGWLAVRNVVLDGGNGGDYGGDGGYAYLYNYTDGYLYVPPSMLSATGGTGAVENGNPGGLYMEGNIFFLGFFPELATLP